LPAQSTYLFWTIFVFFWRGLNFLIDVLLCFNCFRNLWINYLIFVDFINKFSLINKIGILHFFRYILLITKVKHLLILRIRLIYLTFLRRFWYPLIPQKHHFRPIFIPLCPHHLLRLQEVLVQSALNSLCFLSVPRNSLAYPAILFLSTTVSTRVN
jgi:hypothetical protein